MDFMKMMKQAKDLQSKMASLQEEVGDLEVEGTAGAGMVTVRLTGKGEMKGLTIDPSLLKEDEAEILEDLIIAAHADAKGKAEAALQEKTQELMGGLGLPPGMKLPF
ncbi:MAG: YbaB/EbfC family nucleoid-associated protein [Hyphomicrobiales bacterium]|nr:MAG: YbaB/EbfC family nucleoid-associated protein [Hyphomicrobiales bacterium]